MSEGLGTQMAGGPSTETTPSHIQEIVLANTSFGPQEIDVIQRAISDNFAEFTVLRDSVADLETREALTPAVAVRLGVCYYLLGRYQRALQTLQNSDGSALALFYTGRTQLALGEHNAACDSYELAKKAGYDGDYCALGVAEAKRLEGQADEAMAMLDQLFGPIEQTAEYLYQRGATVAATRGSLSEVTTLYERAIENDGKHAGALFGLALENDRRGNDTEAMELYQRAVNCFPANVGSLLNLGLLYEDNQQYERARNCYQRILDAFPDHRQARLYTKDAMASGDMYYDEAAQKATDRLAQVLNVPVTDFELSVRSRNCLQKMGIMTLGDLTRTTEQELLASKNFGETSLIEIRDMLHSKGLELGQFASEHPESEPSVDMSNLTPEEQAMFERPISDLNLSVRARKCMVRLGLTTIGELIRKTGDDLLESKNFGVTSLNEVRDKLSQLGLKLRGD